MKDNFSEQSDEYALYRPQYPAELIDFIVSNLRYRHQAWDCGTGSGQLAKKLAPHFDKIFATDISASQLANAEQKENISYSLQSAEKTDFPAQHFDLISVAQAIHWFDFDLFYKEVKRTLKEDGLIVVTGYNRCMISPEIDAVVTRFYTDIVGPYWDKERKYIDEEYKTIPFPFKEIKAPMFEITLEWKPEHLFGYLGTWSSVKHYKKEKNEDPLELIRKDIATTWPADETRKVKFPVLLRMGRL